jgi:hypothetical protein
VLGVSLAPPGARFHGTLRDLGTPIHTAEYADGYKICTYRVPEDPTIGRAAGRAWRPWVYDEGLGNYVQRQLPEQPRSLYRPENLEAHPDWDVFVLERESMVDAFHTFSGSDEVIATTVAGGCTMFELGIWEPLDKRRVTLLPTNNTASVQAMHQLARKLHRAGATVRIVTLPQELPENFSLHDILDAGWTWTQFCEWVLEHAMAVTSGVVPIEAARARVNAAPPVADPKPPKKATQTPFQIRSWRDVWERVPGITFAPNGTPYSNTANIVKVILAMRPEQLWYDEFHCKIMTGPVTDPRPWTDTDTVELLCALQGDAGLTGARTKSVEEALLAIAHRTRRHEPREWLNSLTWDGDVRLHIMLHRGWGTEASPYTSSVGKNFIMGAVARILRPGCQVDNVPVFYGKGGSRKTSSLRALFGKWFDNPSSMFGDKDFLQNMTGHWCLELGELANCKGRALEIVKSTITRLIDNYRAAYGRIPGAYPRQCVFAATIDQRGWNTDLAGGRRWWPFDCGEIDLDWITANRDQLFAEAVYRVNDGEPWWEVQVDSVKKELDRARPPDPWLPGIAEFCDNRPIVTFAQVLRIGAGLEDKRDWAPASVARVRACLIALGYEEARPGSVDDEWIKKSL